MRGFSVSSERINSQAVWVSPIVPSVERMRRTKSPEAAAAEGVAVARELVAGLKDMAAGLQLSTPSGRLDAALAVLDVI